MMRHEIRPLPFKPAALSGLSEQLIASHYENNYGGAVCRLNAIAAELRRSDVGGVPVYALNGLKREELIATNSMILHELYFDSLSGDGEPGGALAVALERDFGSVARWRAEFVAMGKALAGGSGWVLLARSSRDGRLVNQWAADHTHGLANGVAILALDMYEHAYHMDYGTKAAAYIDAFMRNIDWTKVGQRWRAAETVPAMASADRSAAVTPEALHDGLAAGDDEFILLDVRRRPTFEASADTIAGALWRDPEAVSAWADELPRDKPVVVYCVYGLEIGQNTAAALRAKGIDARYLCGGIAGWRAIGGKTVVKPKGTGP